MVDYIIFFLSYFISTYNLFSIPEGDQDKNRGIVPRESSIEGLFISIYFDRIKDISLTLLNIGDICVYSRYR